MNDFTTDAKMALTNKISLTEIVHQHVEDAVNPVSYTHLDLDVCLLLKTNGVI